MAGSKVHAQIAELQSLQTVYEGRLEAAGSYEPTFHMLSNKARKKIFGEVKTMGIYLQELKVRAAQARATAQEIAKLESEFNGLARKNLTRSEMAEAKKKFKRDVAKLEQVCKKQIAQAKAPIKTFERHDEIAAKITVTFD